MQATITRDMKVMNDHGQVAHFAKSTPAKPFEEISPAVYGRLYRAGAATPYLPPIDEPTKPNEPKGKKSKKS